MINETEVEMENYEEVIGNLDYTTSDQTGQNAGSFKEPTLNQLDSFLAPQDR